ncbi:MAG TPA: hypothetical protein VJ827_04750 [Rubrobacter sp.]|nr:hypothetical protein [Rubrobacter sp.]
MAATEGGEYSFDPRISERLVQVGDPRLYRRGIEAIHQFGVRGERARESEPFEPLSGCASLVFGNDPEADRRRDDPNLVTRL